MDLLYLGSGAFGLPTLQALVRHHTIRVIITQPDRPAGRGGRLTPTPIAQWAAGHLPRVPILKPENINSSESLEQLRAIEASGSPLPLIIIAFGQKLGRALVEHRFAINLHGSLLPRWRGAAPINAAILAGDPRAGNSVITIADRMDAGLILGQSQRDLPPSLTAGELHNLLAADGTDLMASILAAFERGTLTPRAQDESLATRAPKLSRADCWVDFARGAEACRRRIHGLTPWPGITVHLQSSPRTQLKLIRVQVTDLQTEEQPGTVIDLGAGLIACAGSALKLLEVHPAGKRCMSWDDFQHGHHIAAGERLVSEVPPPNA